MPVPSVAFTICSAGAAVRASKAAVMRMERSGTLVFPWLLVVLFE